MLTRRQLRIKVMQALFYFQRQNDAEMKDLEKFLNTSITQTYVLFLYMLQLLVAIHELAVERHAQTQKRHLATDEERNPSTHMLDNWILRKLSESKVIKDALERRKLNPWHLDSNYVVKLYNEIVSSKTFILYTSTSNPSRKEDLIFLLDIYQQIIAPNDDVLNYLEDHGITWVDDYPLVNSAMIQFLRKIKPSKAVTLPDLVKDPEDTKFALELFRKTVLNYPELKLILAGKTPNWDKERIAQIDQVLIIMAQSEFLYFPLIPVKVSLNEYLEIAKDYSSPKSSTFINGILDNMLKEFQSKDQINKIGKGLLQ
ncbi:MAG: transcription antitermination protein NusB [Nonlabens sp.]